MIFQKMCQSIKTCRRSSRHTLDKVKAQTPIDETETVTSNTSASVARDIAFIEEACCHHQKTLPQHQAVHKEERKENIIQSIQEILRNLREEKSVCQIELNDYIVELKKELKLETSESCCCLDDEIALDDDNEQLSYLQTRIELIQQSIVEFTELQYSVEYFKTEKEIRKMEKAFDKYWKKTNRFNGLVKVDNQ